MIHDELAIAIQNLTGLSHGKDFIVAHPIDKDTGEAGEAYIFEWRHDSEPPDVDKIRAEFEAEHRETYEAFEVRRTRDFQISKSDWTQNPDVPVAVREKWKAHRQALRDITKQPGFPLTVEWPKEPT